MDFGTLDSMIQQEDLADADKKKILQGKRWKEHLKEHPGATLISVEKEEEILENKDKETPKEISLQQPSDRQPPPTETKVDAWWLREEERKILEPIRIEMQQSHEAKHIAWECNCGKAMEPPKDLATGPGYKIQKDEEEGNTGSYKTKSGGAAMYGRSDSSQEASGAYLGGGNSQERRDNLYGRPS